MTADRDSRLAEIKARREALGEVLDPEVIEEAGKDELYGYWLEVRYGVPGLISLKDELALVYLGKDRATAQDRAKAEFIARAPADIDWLIGQLEQRQDDH